MDYVVDVEKEPSMSKKYYLLQTMGLKNTPGTKTSQQHTTNTNRMDTYTELIHMTLEEKIERKKPWCNEYGSVHRELYKKDLYKTRKDYKINYYRCPKDNTLYFKVVPSYFSMPGGQYYWEYYDGIVQEDNKSIVWRPIMKTKPVQ
jgi:hypothetical protein